MRTGSLTQESTSQVSEHKNYISLAGEGNSVYVDNVLAQMRAQEAHSDYFTHNGTGKRSAVNLKRQKPINVTPSLPRPFCRYKEFQRMPNFSIDTVSHPLQLTPRAV